MIGRVFQRSFDGKPARMTVSEHLIDCLPSWSKRTMRKRSFIKESENIFERFIDKIDLGLEKR